LSNLPWAHEPFQMFLIIWIMTVTCINANDSIWLLSEFDIILSYSSTDIHILSPCFLLTSWFIFRLYWSCIEISLIKFISKVQPLPTFIILFLKSFLVHFCDLNRVNIYRQQALFLLTLTSRFLLWAIPKTLLVHFNKHLLHKHFLRLQWLPIYNFYLTLNQLLFWKHLVSSLKRFINLTVDEGTLALNMVALLIV